MGVTTEFYTIDTSAYVGPAQYQRCLTALEFYNRHGYTYQNVPWAVGPTALCVTKPPRLPLDECPHFHGMYVVASAEQSFIDQQLDYMQTFAGSRIHGRFVTITPCFRNEHDYDSLHRPYFLKTELVDWDNTSETDLHNMIALADEYFSGISPWFTVDVVETEQASSDPLAVSKTFDIVSRRGRIELGSYGVRQYQDIGKWLYGTGCAEPRLTYAIAKEKDLGGIPR